MMPKTGLCADPTVCIISFCFVSLLALPENLWPGSLAETISLHQSLYQGLLAKCHAVNTNE